MSWFEGREDAQTLFDPLAGRDKTEARNLHMVARSRRSRGCRKFYGHGNARDWYSGSDAGKTLATPLGMDDDSFGRVGNSAVKRKLDRPRHDRGECSPGQSLRRL